MPESVRVGSATIIALSDMQKAYPASAIYPDVAAETWERYREALTDAGEIALNFGCYAIRADGQTVLVDTGWGPSMDGQLLNELRAAEVDPAEIDAVMFTHLHGDHIGWNLAYDGDTPTPRFPRARYLAPGADWRHYRALNEQRGMFAEQMVPLESLGVLDLVDGERTLSASLTIVPTPGHTPGHQSLAVLSGDERAFVLGDAAISTLEAHETDWSSSFDHDPVMSRATRHAALDRLERERALVAACHFPAPGFGYFVRADGRRTWRPLAPDRYLA